MCLCLWIKLSFSLGLIEKNVLNNIKRIWFLVVCCPPELFQYRFGLFKSSRAWTCFFRCKCSALAQPLVSALTCNNSRKVQKDYWTYSINLGLQLCTCLSQTSSPCWPGLLGGDWWIKKYCSKCQLTIWISGYLPAFMGKTCWRKVASPKMDNHVVQWPSDRA